MPTEYDPLASVQAAGPPGTISFVYGLPDPSTFPADDLSRAFGKTLAGQPELALQYGPEQGYGPLIDYLRRKLAVEEGLEISRQQITLTAGSSQILDHLCTLLTHPGEIVLVEAPTYHESLQLFSDHELRPLQIPIDRHGLVIDALRDRLSELDRTGIRPAFLYSIPNYQNPSGITLDKVRRREILDLAAKHDVFVIEDDVYRDLAFDGSTPASMFQLGEGERVLRIGSFSKPLAPGLRMGWLLAAPDRIQQVIHSGLRTMGGGANPLTSNALAAYCQEGLLEAHVMNLRDVYRQRRDLMLAALRKYMPTEMSWTEPRGGFFVWLTLPPPLQSIAVAAQAKARGILVLPGNPFFAEEPTGQHLRLAYSYVSQEKIEAGIRILSEVVA
jgi:DNA-binding transcriptional MocR family regulator